jgi:hypothetical protein
VSLSVQGPVDRGIVHCAAVLRRLMRCHMRTMQAVAAVSGGDAALAAAGARVAGGHRAGGRVCAAGRPGRHLGPAARRRPPDAGRRRRRQARGRRRTVIHATLTQDGMAHWGCSVWARSAASAAAGGVGSRWRQQHASAEDSTRPCQQRRLTASAGGVLMQMWQAPR